MFNLSNGLSFFRAPLALLFLQDQPSLRILAVILAMITDSIDGYFARRYQSTSRFGAILDPLMDKFFVYFALCVLFKEGKILPWQASAFLARDFFLCLYGLWMLRIKHWKSIAIRSVRSGKISTALQFLILVALLLELQVSTWAFLFLFIMGGMAFWELSQPIQRRPAL